MRISRLAYLLSDLAHPVFSECLHHARQDLLHCLPRHELSEHAAYGAVHGCPSLALAMRLLPEYSMAPSRACMHAIVPAQQSAEAVYSLLDCSKISTPSALLLCAVDRDLGQMTGSV